MSEERAAKLRRLDRLRRKIPHVSASALSAILAEVASHGIPERRSRRDIGIARDEMVHCDTPYGKLFMHVPVVRGGAACTMLVINPIALLWKSFREGGGLTAHMTECLVKKPSSPEEPWGLIVYAGEVIPGNALSFDNKRKLWAMYFSFCEFGPVALQREASWFDILCYRSSEIATLDAGVSQAFGAVLKLFFGALPTDVSTSGILLDHPDGRSFRLFIKLAMVLQDGGAHKSIWHCKGDAGTKFCMLCRNLITVKSELVDSDGTHLLTNSLVFEHSLDFATSEDILGSVRRLAALKATVGSTEFELREQAFGFRHMPNGILLDEQLRPHLDPASQFCHDWMHCMVVNGVFGTLVYLVLEDLHKSHIAIWPALCEYVGMWSFPARDRSSEALAACFDVKRCRSSREAQTFKATASECLSVYPMIAYYFQAVVLRAGKCLQACSVLLKLADLMDQLQAIPLELVSPNLLRSTIRKLLRATVDAGWAEYLHPKSHWLVHLPRHLDHFGFLPSCFVHERKHRLVKRYSSDISNTISFDKSVMAELLCQHFTDIEDDDSFNMGVGLLRPKMAPLKMVKFMENELNMNLSSVRITTSPICRIKPTGVCHKKDLVMISSHLRGSFVLAEVWFHAALDCEHVSLVTTYSILGDDESSGTSDWQIQQHPLFISTEDIFASVCYRKPTATTVKMIAPYQFRGLRPANA